MGKKKKRASFMQNKGLLSAIRGLVSCCLGNRNNTDISFMGYDLGDVFEDASTVGTISEETESLPSSRKTMATWAVEPSKKFKSADLRLPEARWLLLAWASRIIKGDTVNKSLLNSLISECTTKRKRVELMSNSIIKTFPGLELAEEIREMSAMDFSVAIDTMMITLNDYVGIDKNTFLLIVKKECCYGVYHIHRGACKDIIIFEIQLFERSSVHHFSRLLSFNEMEKMKEYLIQSKSLQCPSRLSFYLFNFKRAPHNWPNESIIVEQNALENAGIVGDTGIQLKGATDPKCDVKQVYRDAKMIANMNA